MTKETRSSTWWTPRTKACMPPSALKGFKGLAFLLTVWSLEYLQITTCTSSVQLSVADTEGQLGYTQSWIKY